MVLGKYAREDVDGFLLTKVIQYTSYGATRYDLSYDTKNRDSGVVYSIKAQATTQGIRDNWGKEGQLNVGECRFFLRWEYTVDANGNAINPALIPKRDDEIVFLNKRYIIRECTPATSEDDVIIGYDVVGRLSGDE